MQIPDVVAWELAAGKACLERFGISNILVKVTKPPRAKISAGVCRIIRQKALPGGGVELIAAWEHYE
ncbi:MAG: hypothetical protein ACOX8W_07915 [bacterium]|jgi:hypothetical protein